MSYLIIGINIVIHYYQTITFYSLYRIFVVLFLAPSVLLCECCCVSNFHDLCVAGLLQLEMEPSKVYQLLSGLSIPIPHLPLLEPVSSGVSTKLTSPPSVPVPQQSVEEKSPVSGDNKSTLDGNEGVLVGYKGTMDGNQGDSKGTLDGLSLIHI